MGAARTKGKKGLFWGYRGIYDIGLKGAFMGYVGLLLNAPYKIDSMMEMRMMMRFCYVLCHAFVLLFLSGLREPRVKWEWRT
jgi:hypothetical protein